MEIVTITNLEPNVNVAITSVLILGVKTCTVRITCAGEPNALQKLLKHSLQTIKLRRDHKNKMAANTLFGRNLADVCQDGHLPRPLMVSYPTMT